MKNNFCVSFILFFVVSVVSITARAQVVDTISFRFATLEEAKVLVSTDDVFTKGWSEFDVVSRLQDLNGTKEDLLALKKEEVRDWTEKEKQQVLDDMLEFNRIIRKEGYRLPFPEEVVLVKSTMKDEGGAAGYTQANWIALSDVFMERADDNSRRNLLLHELSHILTRNSFGYKRRLYGALGFKVFPDGLEYPDELLEMRISNPDIGAYDSYGSFRINGHRENCAMYMYSDVPYEGDVFFKYVKIAFVPYDSHLKPKRNADGSLIYYEMSQIENFAERIGENTDYIIHPEEILAENFVIAFMRKPDVPTPKLQKRVYKVLRGR